MMLHTTNRLADYHTAAALSQTACGPYLGGTMRVARLVFLLSIAFFLSLSLAAQQTATTSPQALLFLQKSLSALGGAQALTDVTLSGTARRIAGSDDDTGTAVFKALASGAGRTDLSLASGQRSEVCDLSS